MAQQVCACSPHALSHHSFLLLGLKHFSTSCSLTRFSYAILLGLSDKIHSYVLSPSTVGSRCYVTREVNRKVLSQHANVLCLGGCLRNSKQNPDIHFLAFPNATKDPVTQREWHFFVNNTQSDYELTSSSLICHSHFDA